MHRHSGFNLELGLIKTRISDCDTGLLHVLSYVPTILKGADFVVELARRAYATGRGGEFHLVGNAFIEVPSLPNLIAHGPCERDALRSTLAKLQPTLILLPSRFPETYCHTLTEAWSCGVPVLAHQIGALEERVLQHGGGWLADSLDVDFWLSLLDQLVSDRAAWDGKVQAARAADIRSVEAMTQDYRQLYESLMTKER
jgi:glycosyltransferase involved in cell wall biosynthesis